MKRISILILSPLALVLLISIAANHSLTSHSTLQQTKRDVLGAETPLNWASLSKPVITSSETNAETQTTHIALNVSITNTAEQRLEFSPGMQAFIVTNTNERIAATARYTDESKSIGGPIAAGSTWAGILDFDIPTGSSPVQFVFERDAATPAITENL